MAFNFKLPNGRQVGQNLFTPNQCQKHLQPSAAAPPPHSSKLRRPSGTWSGAHLGRRRRKPTCGTGTCCTSELAIPTKVALPPPSRKQTWFQSLISAVVLFSQWRNHISLSLAQIASVSSDRNFPGACNNSRNLASEIVATAAQAVGISIRRTTAHGSEPSLRSNC